MDRAVLGPELVAFVESGCSLILGRVDAHGAPVAGRAWGCAADPDRGRVQLLLGSHDAAFHELAPGDRVALTAASVRDLRSVQLKGRVVALDPPSPDEADRGRRQSDELVRAIVETDGFPRPVVAAWVDEADRACTIEIDEVYDQTPGPGAGDRLDTAP